MTSLAFLKQMLQDVRHQKMRTILTLLGITWGTVSVALLVADFIYFTALRHPDALVSLVSSFRRGSTLVAFAGGLWLFKEANGKQKLPAVIGVLIGIVLTVVG